jgi:hypothetical protein
VMRARRGGRARDRNAAGRQPRSRCRGTTPSSPGSPRRSDAKRGLSTG